MPAPTEATYSAAALIAAHTAFRNLLDAENVEESGVAYINLRTSADVLLGTILLDDPCGAVNGTTGVLTFDIDGRDEAADAGGTLAYGEFCDAAGAVHLSLPAKAGSVADSGWLVMNTLTIIEGGPIEIFSAQIG
jgi:hypothetical protein